MPQFSLFPPDCFQVVGQSPCPELVCTHGHVLARSGGPSDQSQASGRARIGLSLQLLIPSDLNAGRVDLMLFGGPNMESLFTLWRVCKPVTNLSRVTRFFLYTLCTRKFLGVCLLLNKQQNNYGIQTSGSKPIYQIYIKLVFGI